MIKIENTKFDIGTKEIEIKQRMFEGESIVSIQLRTSFYSNLFNDNIVSGSVDVVVDDKIKCLDDLSNKKYCNTGKLTFTKSIDGKWETETYYDFKIEFKERKHNKIKVEIKCNKANMKLETKCFITSLYTTTSTKKEIEKHFDLKDFYDLPIVKELSKSTISKYIVKAKEN
jgi:hypothetical protein